MAGKNIIKTFLQNVINSCINNADFINSVLLSSDSKMSVNKEKKIRKNYESNRLGDGKYMKEYKKEK